jgi:hypothetical protein
VAGLSASSAQAATWAKPITSAGYPQSIQPRDVAVDTAGNIALVVFAGTQAPTSVTINYDGTSETSTTQNLYAVYRTDPNGNHSWHEPFGAQQAGDVSMFPNGDVLVCGNYTGSGAFATGFTLPTAEGRDVWVARYTAIGTLVWARRYGGPGTDGQLGTNSRAGARCEALADGGYLLAATSDGNFAVGGTDVPGSAASVVLARVADDGTPIWTRRTNGGGTTLDTTIVDIVTNGTEAALLAYFDSTTGFETTFDATAGENDIFVARLTL